MGLLNVYCILAHRHHTCWGTTDVCYFTYQVVLIEFPASFFESPTTHYLYNNSTNIHKNMCFFADNHGSKGTWEHDLTIPHVLSERQPRLPRLPVLTTSLQFHPRTCSWWSVGGNCRWVLMSGWWTIYTYIHSIIQSDLPGLRYCDLT